MEVERERPPPPHAEAIPENSSITEHSMGSSKRTMSTKQSRRKSSAQEQAIALSTATSQATAAAKSILMSGGREETALLTAKAAAESVLLERFSVFSSKRQAKQQAQVVASMALVSAQAASNKFPVGTETNIFMQAPAGGSFSGSRKSKPPSVIRQSSTSRREDVSSVGIGDSFTDLDESVKYGAVKALVKNARSNNSNQTNTGQNGRLPPTHPLSSPKSQPSAKKKSSSRNQSSHNDRGSPMSLKSSRTNGSNKSDDLVVHLRGSKKSREDESSNSKDSYFERRRAREQEKKKAKESLPDGVPDENPIYDSRPRLDLVEEQSATFDSDDHSRSAAGTTDDDDDDEEKSFSSDDAFKNVDLKKQKEPVINFGGIVDGMFCGACNVPAKRDHRDDVDDMMSGDNRSQYSDNTHTDDSSRGDIDEPISPLISSIKKKWKTKSPRALSPHTRNKTDFADSKMRHNTPKADPLVVLTKNELIEEQQTVPVIQKPVKGKQTTRKTSNNKSRKKAEVKKKIKESMEKVVLRAMAAGEEKLTLTMSESMTSKNEDQRSHASKRSSSSKASKKSRGSRLSNWMRRKHKK